MASAASDPQAPIWRPRWRLWKAFGVGIVAAAVYASLSDWHDRHLFLINTTDSLPNWAFVISRGVMPSKGDYVFFDPPANALVQRHFGTKPRLFGKIVYGLPGDVVSHDGPMVLVNGQAVGRMKPRSRFGEQLTPGKTGPVPAGCFYAGSPHKDGFDSRYAEIGFICRRQIIGVGEALL